MSWRAEQPQIRVLYLINGMGTGGAERSLADLLPQLAARGVSLDVACILRREQGVQDQVDASRLRFLTAETHWGRIREVRRLLRHLQPEVLHTTLFEADILGRLAAVGTGTPVLTSLVNTSYDDERINADPNLSRTRLAMVRHIDGFTARMFTTHFHALTESVKLSTIAHLRISPDRISVIARGREFGRLGFPSAERRARVRAALELSDTHEVIVTAARQEYQKGQRFLLEAVAHLRVHRPAIRVLIAGRSGNATAELESQMNRLALHDVVRFLGHREDVADLLVGADVFCFPSIYEGFGGAVVEAMFMGAPVVASDIPALREVVGQAGLLIPPGRPDELAGALRRVLDDPALAAQLAAEARSRAIERFNIESVAEQMAALYRRVALMRLEVNRAETEGHCPSSDV